MVFGGKVLVAWSILEKQVEGEVNKVNNKFSEYIKGSNLDDEFKQGVTKQGSSILLTKDNVIDDKINLLHDIAGFKEKILVNGKLKTIEDHFKDQMLQNIFTPRHLKHLASNLESARSHNNDFDLSVETSYKPTIQETVEQQVFV